MKRALTIFAALILAGCANDDVGGVAPTGAFPTPTPRTILRGLVVNESGECIRGATVQIVVAGQESLEAIEQRTPCAVWDYDDNVGFVIEDVPVGVAMTIRSSAPGFATEEQTIIPTWSPVVEVFLTLRPLSSDR